MENKKAKKVLKKRVVTVDEATAMLEKALKLEPRDVKVPISLRLDSDLYLALKRHAEQGAGDGKYQLYINQILRNYFFAEAIPGKVSQRHTKHQRSAG